MEPDSWIALVVALLCLSLIALDSAVETALINISRLRLRQLLERGVRRAQAINDLLDNPQRFPATLLFVNTLALGCLFTQAAQAGPDTGSHDETLMHGGVQRHYRLHVPVGYNTQKPVPLVLMLHGRGGNGKGFEQLTGMSAVADKETFLVAYPDALGKPPAWTSG